MNGDLYQRMFEAALTMQEVNEIYRREYPERGSSLNEPMSPSSMFSLAHQWKSEGVA